MERKYDSQHSNSSQNSEGNNNPPLMLTISEYEEIALRLDESLKHLSLIVDALSTPENLEALRPKVE